MYCAQNQKIIYIPILVRNTVFPQMVVATSILFGRVKVQQLGIPKREPISVKSKFYKKRGATFFYDITRKLGPLDFTQYRSKSSSF